MKIRMWFLVGMVVIGNENMARLQNSDFHTVGIRFQRTTELRCEDSILKIPVLQKVPNQEYENTSNKITWAASLLGKKVTIASDPMLSGVFIFLNSDLVKGNIPHSMICVSDKAIEFIKELPNRYGQCSMNFSAVADTMYELKGKSCKIAFTITDIH